ncbi:ABC transporter substrate-binding protein [Kineosporia mesophila]|uniref:ABC transporter substrate-binding protein n=1 Tax=Kineosporia mesophila TaxID=566012 RepID=UPI001E606598|nr:ABC transporter substrate-binding protein [Kineosporia mesophila]MCD5350316.1 ABC transporter substrate-binding protein [Kineosporia mesophila]
MLSPPSPRKPLLIAAVLGAALIVSGCTVANSEYVTGGGAGGLRIVLPEEPPTLEACQSSLTSTGVVLRSNITEPLVERDADTGELAPKLATAWEQTSDDTWTFTLRKGVTFTDGTPFDADAAAFTIDRAVNSDLGCEVEGYVFGDTDLDVKAVDATTLTVTTPEPDPILPLRLSFVEMVSTKTSTTEKVRVPIGTGPYEVADWQSGQRLSLEANPNYWGGRPGYQSVNYVWRAEGSVRAAMVTNGEADIATSLAPEDGAGELAVAYRNNETTALRIQADQPPLDDIRVRQAINYVVDRNTLVKTLFENLATPAGELIPEGIVGYNPDEKVWPYDPAKARELVAQAKADGVPVDTQIRLIARTGQFPRIAETIEVIQSELAKAGLNVKIQMMDTNTQLTYQIRPFPEDTGPYLLMIMHGNQAGDAAFTLDQYMLREGYQSSWGTEEFDASIRDAEELKGDERQAAFEKLWPYEQEKVVQYAYIAHMSAILARSASVSYQPDSATGDEMRLAEMSPVS